MSWALAIATHHALTPTVPSHGPAHARLTGAGNGRPGVTDLRDSIAFTAGQQYERRRVGELLRQRISDLSTLGAVGLPARTVKALTAEVQLLITVIEQEPT